MSLSSRNVHARLCQQGDMELKFFGEKMRLPGHVAG